MTTSGGRTPGALAPGSRPPLAVPRRLLRLRSDAALAERFALGDEAAFDVLYERYRPAVLSVCMGILGEAHDAEDVTQETFSALAVALRGTPPRELRPWLARVARNRAIDVTRRGRQRALTRDGELPDIAARQHTGKAELAVVFEGIRELPESQRTALLMRELGGHSYGDIAALLETHEDAVRGLIARARVGLRSYREAALLPCAEARASIEAEPDGRRHNRAVRRHLRGCASCRAYRTALRDDARALRAILPIDGGIPGGGMLGGGLAASKGALVGVGLTQASAACAASVCAAGAVGSIVLIAPLHRMVAPMPMIAAHRHNNQTQPVAKPLEVPRSVSAARLTNLTSTPSSPQHAAASSIPATSVTRLPAAHVPGGGGDRRGTLSRANRSHHRSGSLSRPSVVPTAPKAERVKQYAEVHRQTGPERHEAGPMRYQGDAMQHRDPVGQQGDRTAAGTTRHVPTSPPLTAATQAPAQAPAQATTSAPVQTSSGATRGTGSRNPSGWTGDHSSSHQHASSTGNAGSADQNGNAGSAVQNGGARSAHQNGNAGSHEGDNGNRTASGHARSASAHGLAVGNHQTSAGSSSTGTQKSTSRGWSARGSSGSHRTDKQTSGHGRVQQTGRSTRRHSGAATGGSDLTGGTGAADGLYATKDSRATAAWQTGSGSQTGGGSQTPSGSQTGGGFQSPSGSQAVSESQSRSAAGTYTTSSTATGPQSRTGTWTDSSSAASGTAAQTSPPASTTSSQTVTSPSGWR